MMTSHHQYWKIGVVLWVDHTAKLVYSNHKDMRSDYSHRNYCKWMKTTKTLNCSALLLYNACTLLSMEICVTDNNKLKIHPKKDRNLLFKKSFF